MDGKYDYLFKLLLLGDVGVGKRCIQTRFAHDVYQERFIGIIRIEFTVKIVELEGKRIKLQIWDDCIPISRYKNIFPSFFRGVRGVIFVYDATDQNSFDNINTWLEIVDIFAPPNARKLLIGNKCDSTENKVVDYVTAKEFADHLGIPFFETSAKNGTNVEQAFMTMAAEINKIYVPPTPTPTPTPTPADVASEQGGVFNSITSYFYNFFGFGKETSGKNNNDGTTSEESKSDKKVILQVSKDKETEITLDDFRQMSDADLKINGQVFKIRRKLI